MTDIYTEEKISEDLGTLFAGLLPKMEFYTPVEVGEGLAVEFANMGVVALTEMERTMNLAVLMIERDAKIFCPVDTGRLRASISHRIVKENTLIYAECGTNVHYAPYVEFGLVSKPNYHPRSYLTPAWHKNKYQIATMLKDYLDKLGFSDSAPIIIQETTRV